MAYRHEWRHPKRDADRHGPRELHAASHRYALVLRHEDFLAGDQRGALGDNYVATRRVLRRRVQPNISGSWRYVAVHMAGDRLADMAQSVECGVLSGTAPVVTSSTPFNFSVTVTDTAGAVSASQKPSLSPSIRASSFRRRARCRVPTRA